MTWQDSFLKLGDYIKIMYYITPIYNSIDNINTNFVHFMGCLICTAKKSARTDKELTAVNLHSKDDNKCETIMTF